MEAKAQPELPLGETLEPEETVEVVIFTGQPGTRLITAEEWAGAGVPDHPDTRWDANNNWTIRSDDLGLNGEQFGRIIVADRGLQVTRVPASDVR